MSEEDVKNKIVLPMLRALGYSDADFNYERRTGRGYVDIVVEHYPTGIVVETKVPRKRLENHIDQLESYVFQKHGRDRATLALLTDGEFFQVFGVTSALYRGTLADHLLHTFRRSQLADPTIVSKLGSLLSASQNKAGGIPQAVDELRQELGSSRERLREIEVELQSLTEERDRIDGRIRELQTLRSSIFGPPTATSPNMSMPTAAGDLPSYPAIPHILRVFQERKATSKSSAADRSELDAALVGKVPGIAGHAALSWGLIELKKAGKIDYEKRGGKMRQVWLTS